MSDAAASIWKRLVHFDSPSAVQKAQAFVDEFRISNLTELSQVHDTAVEFKWAIKALLYFRWSPILPIKALALIDGLISWLHDRHDQKAFLLWQQTMAVLLHCKSLIVFIESPELVYPLIDQVK